MDSDMVEFTFGHAVDRQLGDFEMSDVHGGHVVPASYLMHYDSSFTGFEQSGSIGDSDALYSSSSTFGLGDGPDFQNSHIEAQDSYFQFSEGPSSVSGDTGHFHVQATEIAPDPTFGETGPTTAHYGFQYPSDYDAICSPTLASEALAHAQDRNIIVSPVSQPVVLPTQVPPAHPEPLSFVHHAPIDPGHSNDTGPGVPSTVAMNVPLVIDPTKAAIEYYVRDFKQILGNHVKKVTCSTCLLEDTRRTTQHSTKPTNLERHLFSHFGVKPSMCAVCPKRFTTQDQQARHRCDYASNI